MAALRRINQDDLRNHNLSVVLDTLLRSTEPLSRAELAKTTGLTKATMSLLVPMLISAGAVREGEPSVMAGYGRPSTPLGIAGGRFCGIGMQINTDGYGVTVVDLDGSTVTDAWAAEPMEHRDPAEVFAALNTLAARGEQEAAARGYRVVGACLALPGLVTDDRRLLVARNLGWERLDLGLFDVMRRLDAEAGNEANMAALAQIPGYATQRRREGLIGPSDSFLYVSSDIGVGGAVVCDGQVVTGDRGFAGEIGHLAVSLDGPACSCGRHGCLEAYAGRRALVERAGVAEGEAAVRDESFDELLRRLAEGDTQTVTAVDDATRAIASAVASAVNLLDVDMVVLGGLWERFGEQLASRVEREANPQLIGHPSVRVKVRMPEVGGRAALRGAAKVGLRRFIDNPLPLLTSLSD